MRATCGVVSARKPSIRPDSGSTRLERDEVEVAPGAGQQRVEELDERRLHQRDSRALGSGRAACGAAPPRARASAGSTSSIASGRSHLRILHRREEPGSTPEPRSRRARRSAAARRTARSPCETSHATAPARRTATRLRGSEAWPAPPTANPRAVPRDRCARYFAGARGARPAPDCLKYWKNSPLGSSTMRSLRPRNVALYASRLR